MLSEDIYDGPGGAMVAVFAIGAVGAVIASRAIFAVCIVIVYCCPEMFVRIGIGRGSGKEGKFTCCLIGARELNSEAFGKKDVC
jgi:hypothetical protein